MSEHDNQAALFNLLRMYEDKYPQLKWIFAIPNGGHRHISVARKLKSEGVLAGAWDVFVPVAQYGDDGYCGMFVEMKVKPNKLTANQEAFKDGVGYDYEWRVCYSAIEAAHAIGEYLGIIELTEIE